MERIHAETGLIFVGDRLSPFTSINLCIHQQLLESSTTPAPTHLHLHLHLHSHTYKHKVLVNPPRPAPPPPRRSTLPTIYAIHLLPSCSPDGSELQTLAYLLVTTDLRGAPAPLEKISRRIASSPLRPNGEPTEPRQSSAAALSRQSRTSRYKFAFTTRLSQQAA